jgi:DNA-binding HxlR family transcriptional regulator
MRSYGQYCSLAKALDVIGDRWTLLILRELILQGPCRYTDLKHGLPGIATNLLSDRLRELESAGLIRREEAAPPVATTLFHLTDAGTALEPALIALAGWGIRYMADPDGGEEFRSHWFSFAVSVFLRDRDPGAPAASIELRTEGRPAVIEVSGGSVQTRLGPAARPDLVLSGSPRLILGLLSGQLPAARARDLGLTITGDTAILDRVLPEPGTGPKTGPGPAPSARSASLPGREIKAVQPVENLPQDHRIGGGRIHLDDLEPFAHVAPGAAARQRRRRRDGEAVLVRRVRVRPDFAVTDRGSPSAAPVPRTEKRHPHSAGR